MTQSKTTINPVDILASLSWLTPYIRRITPYIKEGDSLHKTELC